MTGKFFGAKKAISLFSNSQRAVQDGENLRLRITGHRRGVVAGGRIPIN